MCWLLEKTTDCSNGDTMDRLPDTKLSSSFDSHQMSLHRDLCSQCSDLPLKNLLGTLRFLIQTVYHTTVNDLVFL